MAVTVSGLGKRTITGYSVQEDATPLDVSSTEGGVGAISFAIAADNDSIMLFDNEIVLVDDIRGTTSGLITGVSVSNGINSVSADSALGVLVGTTQALPKVGTFQTVAEYYLSLGGISTSTYFDPSISDIPVSTSGWYGDAWLNLKQLAMAHGVEIALVSNKIAFRRVRSLLTSIRRLTDFSVSLQRGDIAKAVEIGFYDNFQVLSEVVYPRTADELSAAQVYQVEAGAVLEDDIELTASLSSIDQPTCVADVAQDYDGNQSVYSVRAVDNSVVSPETWAAQGGKIELTLNDDTTSVHIKLTGASDQTYGPYRIAGRMAELDSTNTTILPPGSANPNEASDAAITAAAKAKADAAAAAAKAKATTSTSTTTSIDYPAAVDDYPWKHAATHGLSPLRYDYRDCTDFVAWRINRDSGHTKAPWKYTWANLRKTNGNAIGWKHDWELAGRATGIAPTPGAIAWFGSSAGAYGHVAYVQAVNGNNVTLEEYNWGGNQAYHKRTVNKSVVGSFLANPAGSTKTIVTTTAKAVAAKAAVVEAVKADATANAAVADPAQSEKDYNSLRIVGSGTLINKQTLILPTGAAADRTATDIGVTVENAYVNTIDDAYRVGVYVASRYKGEEHTISGTLSQINQQSGAGNILYKTIEQFNRTYAGNTIADFNAANAGKTIAQFDADQRTDSIGTFFDNQAFGNVCGARFKYANAYWRITSSTITQSGIDITATRDTMIEDFNEAHAGMTIADFNAMYAGKTMKQFGRIPLLGG